MDTHLKEIGMQSILVYVDVLWDNATFLMDNIILTCHMKSCRGAVLCKYYMHGACNRGDSCPFSHNTAVAPNTVSFFFDLFIQLNAERNSRLD